ncbi:MAG: hypothetical protein IPO14_01950 [Saprospiraceae bacterium]|nr:hypothetical protein [Saprospiraceae bacterium]
MNDYSKQMYPGILGLFISFLGTLPLGVLNVFGAYLYQKLGLEYLISFGMGIVVIEVIVLLLIIYLLNWIRNQTQWISILTNLSNLAFILIGVGLIMKDQDVAPIHNENLSMFAAFGLGMFGNAINPIQVGFWIPWTFKILYSKNETERREKGRIFWWILGASVGTMLGLIVFAVLMAAFHEKFVAKLANIDDIIGGVFVLYGLFQITLSQIKKGRPKDSPL